MQQVQSNFTFLQDVKIITLSNVINLMNMMIKKFCFGMHVYYFLDAMGERYFKVCNNLVIIFDSKILFSIPLSMNRKLHSCLIFSSIDVDQAFSTFNYQIMRLLIICTCLFVPMPQLFLVENCCIWKMGSFFKDLSGNVLLFILDCKT